HNRAEYPRPPNSPPSERSMPPTPWLPPTIEVDVKLIEGLVVKAGSTIVLPARLTGIPMPTAKWSSDGKEMASEGRVTIETLGSNTMLSISECQRGDTGEYILSASNPAGSKSVALHVTVLDLPGPPIGPVNILEVTPEYMMVQWRAPKDDGGTPITNYVVEKKDVKKPWEPWSTPVLDLRYRVSGLCEGNSYEFRVFAENVAGISEPSLTSDPIKAARALTRPGPPGNLKLKDWSKSYADICWTKPTRDGGNARALARDKRTDFINNYPEILHYLVEKREIDKKTWATVKGEVLPDKIPFKVSGLQSGTEYYFRVTAVNQYGPGVPRVTPTSYMASDPISEYPQASRSETP
uniref:Titin n=1 Tax=Periophthalmus magnuspinnatus TaxID=409849 RepID=A0A3B4AC94_9GOBI